MWDICTSRSPCSRRSSCPASAQRVLFGRTLREQSDDVGRSGAGSTATQCRVNERKLQLHRELAGGISIADGKIPDNGCHPPRSQQLQVARKSGHQLFTEVSASKVALYPLPMLPTLPIEPQPAATFGTAASCKSAGGGGRAKPEIFQSDLNSGTCRMRHAPREASFEAQASDQSRRCAGARRCRLSLSQVGKRIRSCRLWISRNL